MISSLEYEAVHSTCNLVI